VTYLLDTNIISELRRASMADPRVQEWTRRKNLGELHLSVISVLEVELGPCRSIARIGRRRSPLDWLNNQVLPGFGSRILPVDVAVARRCARLHVPDPRADRDALIAATALVHGFTVVTRNVRDFEPTAVATLNPWTAAT
jgi:predicted nucleic acid-binding protein